MFRPRIESCRIQSSRLFVADAKSKNPPMKISFRSLSLSALTGALLLCGHPCFAQGANQGTIVFIPKSTSATFYLFLVKGAKDRAKELGYTIDYQGPASETEIAARETWGRKFPKPHQR